MFAPARPVPPRAAPPARPRPGRLACGERRRRAETELRETLARRLAFWCGKMDLRYHKLRIKDQSTRWASCSKKGNLNFNWRLLWAPPEVLDYVIVHELCHLVEMNHSKRYWAQVAVWCPDYKKHRKWLRVHGRDLGRGARPGPGSAGHALDVDRDLHLVAQQGAAGV
ncbi:MAG: M48 family metallopeptidase [Elusimicrobia bacterium]|nr:M48 family metallopeptidase [Elusimicrobiota bacterium]